MRVAPRPSASRLLLRNAVASSSSTPASLRAISSSSSAKRALPVDPSELPPAGSPAPTTSASSTPSAPDGSTRHDWTRKEVSDIYNSPLLELVFRAATVHRLVHPKNSVQLCTLMNIKEGGCSEDCGYCSQSSKYTTPSTPSKLSDVDEVLVEARKAKANGSTRFCMGAAWREVGGRKRGFDRILKMVTEIRGMGMEVCTTLGMLTKEQAAALKNAGLTAYNHNLDTSREYYGKVSASGYGRLVGAHADYPTSRTRRSSPPALTMTACPPSRTSAKLASLSAQVASLVWARSTRTALVSSTRCRACPSTPSRSP